MTERSIFDQLERRRLQARLDTLIADRVSRAQRASALREESAALGVSLGIVRAITLPSLPQEIRSAQLADMRAQWLRDLEARIAQCNKTAGDIEAHLSNNDEEITTLQSVDLSLA